MKTNNLKYQASRKIDKETLKVSVQLNDECKNGHQDFSITATLYERGRDVAGGCLHDEVIKFFPELKPFVHLHLSDCKGAPMYTIGNGYYHLKNSSDKIAIDYLRLTESEYDTLNGSENELGFSGLLFSLGIVDRWKTEADKAIKYLEELTGDTFINDSKKSNIHLPSKE